MFLIKPFLITKFDCNINLPFFPLLPIFECILVLDETFPLAFRPFLFPGVSLSNMEGGSKMSDMSESFGENGESMSMSIGWSLKSFALERKKYWNFGKLKSFHKIIRETKVEFSAGYIKTHSFPSKMQSFRSKTIRKRLKLSMFCS